MTEELNLEEIEARCEKAKCSDGEMYYAEEVSPIVEKDVPALCREVRRLRDWVNDLHSGMFINCVYCGHRYGPKDKVPCAMSEVLKLHIEQCPEHPMSKLKAENERLRDWQKRAAELLRSIHSTGCGDHAEYAAFAQLLSELKEPDE